MVSEEGRTIQVNDIIEAKIAKGEISISDTAYQQNTEFIDELFAQSRNVRNVYRELISHKGWTTRVDNCNGISVYYRKEENTPVHTFKAKFRCQCDVLSFVATINEFDLVQNIVSVPGVSLETRYLKEISDVNKVCYSKAELCWPLTNRDCVAQAVAHNCLDCFGGIILIGQSIHSQLHATKLGFEMPTVAKNTSRLDLKLACGMIAPIQLASDNSRKDCIEITSVFNIDFRSAIPQKLINWATRTFGYYCIVSVRNLCENLNCSEIHMQRMQDNPVYARYRKMFDEWNSQRHAKQLKNDTNDKVKEKEDDHNTKRSSQLTISHLS